MIVNNQQQRLHSELDKAKDRLAQRMTDGDATIEELRHLTGIVLELNSMLWMMEEGRRERYVLE